LTMNRRDELMVGSREYAGISAATRARKAPM
jgi:hypothetical protein